MSAYGEKDATTNASIAFNQSSSSHVNKKFWKTTLDQQGHPDHFSHEDIILLQDKIALSTTSKSRIQHNTSFHNNLEHNEMTFVLYNQEYCPMRVLPKICFEPIKFFPALRKISEQRPKINRHVRIIFHTKKNTKPSRHIATLSISQN